MFSITGLFNEALIRPLFNLLVGLANNIPGHSLGWAIIGVTIVVRLVLLPSSLHQAKGAVKNQKKMADVQKQIADIKEKHKDDTKKQSEETMKVYRKAGINPASGCLPLLIQLPILLALYRVFLVDLGPDSYSLLYSFVGVPMDVTFGFFGIDLSTPSLRLAILAGLAQFVQMKWMMPTPSSPNNTDNKEDAAAIMQSMQKNMAYIFPVMTVFIAMRLPSALALYWFVSTLFAAGQHWYVKRTHGNTGMPTI